MLVVVSAPQMPVSDDGESFLLFHTTTLHRAIAKEEGVGGLMKGCAPTAVRAMGLNLGMLGGNSVAKEQLSKRFGLEKSSNVCVFGASAIAGFFASFFSLPFGRIYLNAAC